MVYLIAYDIATSKRRGKILDALRDCGMPVQRSVAECELTPDQAAALREKLRRMMRRSVDQIRIYPLCQACYLRSEVLGPDPIPVAGPLAPRKKKVKP